MKTYRYRYHDINDVPERYVHLSNCVNLTTLIPKIPTLLEHVDNELKENNIMPRVCFSTRIQLALNSMPNVNVGDVYYVYVADYPFPYLPGKRDVAREMRENGEGPVYDAVEYNECWALEPVNVFLWKTIRVSCIDEMISKRFYDVV